MKTTAASEASLELKTLVFQMHLAGYTQEAIAAYLEKSKSTINELLKPLTKGKTKHGN